MAGIAMLCVIAVGIQGANRLDALRNSAMKSSALTDQALRCMVAIDRADTRFKTQMQNWQDILIWGNNPELFAQYKNPFVMEESIVQESLNNALPLMKSIGLADDDVLHLRDAHRDLGVKYRARLNQLHSADPDSGKKADALIEDIGHTIGQDMERVTNTVALRAMDLAKIEGARAEVSYASARDETLGAALIGVIVIALTSALTLLDLQKSLRGGPGYTE